MKMVMPSCIAHRSLSLAFNPEVNVKQTTTACITEKKKKKKKLQQIGYACVCSVGCGCPPFISIYKA